MEQTLEKDLIKVGSIVKLREYSSFNDYKRHHNEEALVIDTKAPGNLHIRIQWENGHHSCISPRNVILVNKDWDS